MISFLLLTAFTVSIDSFFCGFSFGTNKTNKFKVVGIVSLTVLIMCLFTNYLSAFLSPLISRYSVLVSGIILISVSAYNFLKKEQDYNTNVSTKSIIITGFAVGIDGAVANLSLSLLSINAFYVPVIIASFHAIMISLGIILCNFPIIEKLKKYGFISPLILFLLGLYKIATFFI